MWPHSNGDLILGRLLEKSEQNGRNLDRLEVRAIERLDRIDGRLEAIGRDVSAVSCRRKSPPVSPLERRLKNLAGYLVPLAVLWATGSVQQAAELFKVLR